MRPLSELADGYEPTTIFLMAGTPRTDIRRPPGGQGVYPGYGDWWVAGEGYTGTHPIPIPGPILYYI